VFAVRIFCESLSLCFSQCATLLALLDLGRNGVCCTSTVLWGGHPDEQAFRGLWSELLRDPNCSWVASELGFCSFGAFLSVCLLDDSEVFQDLGLRMAAQFAGFVDARIGDVLRPHQAALMRTPCGNLRRLPEFYKTMLATDREANITIMPVLDAFPCKQDARTFGMFDIEKKEHVMSFGSRTQ
jgi:hypothetical protein